MNALPSSTPSDAIDRHRVHDERLDVRTRMRYVHEIAEATALLADDGRDDVRITRTRHLAISNLMHLLQ